MPAQPLASQTSLSVVRIHHFDRGRVIITNQIITQSHPIHSATCNEFFAHVLRRATSFPVRKVGHYKLGLLQSSNGEENPSASSGIIEAHLPSSEYRSSPPLSDHSIPAHLPLAHLPSPGPSHGLSGMELLLTLPSFTQPNELCLPYPISPYDVETARHEHLTNYSFHGATDHVPPRLASFTVACPPALRLRIRVDPRQVLHLPLDSPCVLRNSAQSLRVSSTSRWKLVDTIRLRRSECKRASCALSDALLACCRRSCIINPFQ